MRKQKEARPIISLGNLSTHDILWFRRTLTKWGRKHYRDFPWRSEHFPFHCLTAEILLQRTRAEQVVPVYQEFKTRFPDAGTLCAAAEDEILHVIRPLGLAWRSRFLKLLGCAIKEHIPENINGLVKLPGVGPYAACAYLSMHGGKRCAIVDSNIVRFYGRYFGFKTNAETRRSKTINQLAEILTPAKAFRKFNYALLDFCALVCMPRSAHEVCPLKDKCAYAKSEKLIMR